MLILLLIIIMKVTMEKAKAGDFLSLGNPMYGRDHEDKASGHFGIVFEEEIWCVSCLQKIFMPLLWETAF